MCGVIIPTESLQFGLKDPSLIKTQGLINGQWVDAKSGGKILVTSEYYLPERNHAAQIYRLDPSTTSELGSVPEMGLEETRKAINAAGEAFKTWGTTTAKVSIWSVFFEFRG